MEKVIECEASNQTVWWADEQQPNWTRTKWKRKTHTPKPNTIRFDSIRFTLIHFLNEIFVIQLFSLLLLLSRPVSTNLRHECRRKAIRWLWFSLLFFCCSRLKFKYTYFCLVLLLSLALWSLDPFHVDVTFRFSILLNIYQFELRLIMALTISMTSGTDQKKEKRTMCAHRLCAIITMCLNMLD